MNISINLTWKKFVGVCVISCFIFSGCATMKPITSEALTPSNLSVSTNYNDTVTVVVENGREFNPMNLPKLSNEALAAAVTNAIIESKLFSEILPSGGRYALKLYVVNVSQPYAGRTMTAGVEIAWILKDMKAGTVVWKESIQTEKTLTQEQEHIAIKRLRRATELAAKENIKMGVEKISNLQL